MFPEDQILNAIKVLEEKNYELSLSYKELKELNKKIKETDKLILNLEKIKELIIKLGEFTQQEAISYIEETTTLALQYVFGQEYKFKIVKETKREQQEISFFIDKNGILLEPKQNTVGGGIIDICSLALRLIVWTLEKNTTCPIFFLDEPFKNVSAKYKHKATPMLKTISEMLKIQVIMVSHLSEHLDCADNIIEI